MPVAVASLIISTPAQPDADPESVARDLRNNAEVAEKRAAAVEMLHQRGWEMQQPFVMGDSYTTPGRPDDYQDVVVYFRKEFATSEEAEAEIRACGCSVSENWSIGWNDSGKVNEFGHPEVEWWGEA